MITTTAAPPIAEPTSDPRRGVRAGWGRGVGPWTLRIAVLFAGLFLYGLSAAMLLGSGLGAMPWDVLHEGVALHSPLSVGVVSIVVAALVLLAWAPIRQRPGLGTVCNVVLIGTVIDLMWPVIGSPQQWWAKVALMLGGIVLNAVATVMYIGADLGPGPRDGLMTGLVRRTGRSIRLVRSTIELTVVLVGWLLGGPLGIGTVLYAIAIGPLIQLVARRSPLPAMPGAGVRKRRGSSDAACSSSTRGSC